MSGWFTLQVDGQTVFELECADVESSSEVEYGPPTRAWGGNIVRQGDPIGFATVVNVKTRRGVSIPQPNKVVWEKGSMFREVVDTAKPVPPPAVSIREIDL